MDEGFYNSDCILGPDCDLEYASGGECYMKQCIHHCGDEPICCFEEKDE